MPTNRNLDSVLLVGFGAPSQSSEAPAFVRGIVGRHPAAAERIQEVAHHYQVVGGSPFNELTFQQAEALRAELVRRGIDVPVLCGMRYWTPRLSEVIPRMSQQGLRRTLAFILAPHRCWVSWDAYQDAVRSANEAAAVPLAISYAAPWWKEPGFIRANAARIRDAFAALGDRGPAARLILTAHAIPSRACSECRNDKNQCTYAPQFHESARLIAEAVGRAGDYLTCFQSQPSGAAPSTRPDLNELLARLDPGAVKDVVLAPIGFLCDHVEVLYDLDVEARETCAALGIRYQRARTVESHGSFIDMLADRVSSALDPTRSEPAL